MTQPADSSGISFECKSCGAKLSYDAQTQGMRCPFCSHGEAVPEAAAAQTSQAVREIPIEEGLQRAQRGLGAEAMTLGCRDCGATVHVAPGQQTAKCSFCGSGQVLQQPADPNLIRPESLVPFRVDRARSIELFRTWVRGLWFRPSALKHMARVEQVDGVYVPFWTFDSLVTSQWTAERGIYYREMETYTTQENGQTVQKQREVTRTRWEPASGRRQDPFDDVIVCASRGLPESLVDRFGTFNTRELVAYQPQFLAGWRAESYAIELMPAWGKAQRVIAAKQEWRCTCDIGGDTHRGLSVHNQFDRVTFKHVLLPVWIAAYRFQNKPYQFLVNGQTGEVVGKAPWSIIKIVLFIAFLVALAVGIWAIVQATQSGHTPSSASAPATTGLARPAQPPTPTTTSTTTKTRK